MYLTVNLPTLYEQAGAKSNLPQKPSLRPTLPKLESINQLQTKGGPTLLKPTLYTLCH